MEQIGRWRETKKAGLKPALREWWAKKESNLQPAD
jgi:hypothetical protein